MICPFCNNTIEDNSKKCDICGVSLDRNTVLSQVRRNYSGLDLFITIILVFNGLFMVAAGAGITIGIFKYAMDGLYMLYGIVVFGLALAGYGVGLILNAVVNGEKNKELGATILNISSKAMLGGFYVFWFGFLILADIQLAKEPDGLPVILFTLIFWVAGIFSMISSFRKKR